MMYKSHDQLGVLTCIPEPISTSWYKLSNSLSIVNLLHPSRSNPHCASVCYTGILINVTVHIIYYCVLSPLI